MAEEIYCKQLKAIYEDNKGLLPGPVISDIKIGDGYHIKIEQCGVRTITISNEEEVKARSLYAVLSYIVRLLMIFDGRFYKLREMIFSESIKDADRLEGYALNLKYSRLTYFDSDSVFDASDKICSFEEVLTPDLYNNWIEILEELDISHQVFLYSLSANKMPVDLKVSFMIELAEPVIELLKKKTGLYASLTPGERGTPLKVCLDALITQYGQDIFKKEIDVNYASFLQTLVNSRIRIMHIKKNQKGIYLNGEESVLYIIKISLLYRYILLNLLSVSKTKMIEQIKQGVAMLDKWNDTLDRFLVKIC